MNTLSDMPMEQIQVHREVSLHLDDLEKAAPKFFEKPTEKAPEPFILKVEPQTEAGSFYSRMKEAFQLKETDIQLHQEDGQQPRIVATISAASPSKLVETMLPLIKKHVGNDSSGTVNSYHGAALNAHFGSLSEGTFVSFEIENLSRIASVHAQAKQAPPNVLALG